MHRIFLFSLVFIFSLGFISCKKMNEPDYNNPGKSQFPMSVGSVWEYAIVDTLIHTYTGETEIHHDTVDVTIIGTTTLSNGKNAAIWQYKFRNKIDSLFVFLSDDSLIFYDDDEYLTIKFGFMLQLQANNEWELSAINYKVFLKDTLQVPVGLFVKVYHVEEYERQGNVIGWNDYFIVPKIGIVKYHYGTFFTISEINNNIEWKLLAYSIIE